jgi:hypothetical protein
MKNFIILIIIAVSVLVIIWEGTKIASNSTIEAVKSLPENSQPVPYLGSIELLNGCGIDGAAREVASYLRSKSFDVKNIENASQWNNTSTLVISRIKDTTMASKVASALKTNKVTFIYNNNKLYDVTVIIGSDYKERIQ